VSRGAARSKRLDAVVTIAGITEEKQTFSSKVIHSFGKVGLKNGRISDPEGNGVKQWPTDPRRTSVQA